MSNRLGYLVGWFLATCVAVFLAYQAVGLVGSQITDRPLTLAAVPTAPTVTALESIPEALEPAPAVDPIDRPEPGDSVPGPTSTSSTQAAPASPPSTQAPSTTNAPSTTSPTTTLPPTTTTEGKTTTGPFYVHSEGGRVTVFCQGDNVGFGAAVASRHFTTEIEDYGPTRVKVEFKSDDHKWTIKVTCSAGEPVPDIDEDDDDHHDD